MLCLVFGAVCLNASYLRFMLGFCVDIVQLMCVCVCVLVFFCLCAHVSMESCVWVPPSVCHFGVWPVGSAVQRFLSVKLMN